MDPAGNLYGTTWGGGASSIGGGTVFQLTPNPTLPWTETVLYSFCSQSNCTDGFFPSANLLADSSGNLYSTTPYGGANGGGTVFELKPLPVALSSGGNCNGIFHGTFPGNITISAGQSCTFTQPCDIEGNVTVKGGTFQLLGCTVDGNLTENAGGIGLGKMSKVRGNVQISGGSNFDLGPGGSIGGNLQIQQLSTALSATVCGMTVNGICK